MRYTKIRQYDHENYRLVLDVACQSCGAELNGTEKFCPNCGTKLAKLPRAVAMTGDLTEWLCESLTLKVAEQIADAYGLNANAAPATEQPAKPAKEGE